MVKRLFILAAVLSLACITPPTQINISEGVDLTGEMNGQNTVNDTTFHEVLRLMGEGATYFNSGGLSYMWIYHKYKTDSVVTDWTQLTNTVDKSGGGDTSSSLTMTASHTAGSSYSYDSIFRLTFTYGGYFTDSATVKYFTQTDTTVLAADEVVTYDWTVTADSATTGILSALLYHIIYGLQTGYCEKVDSMDIIFKWDTVTVPLTFAYNFTNDSIVFTGIATERDSLDTLKRVRLKDESGTLMTSFAQNVEVDSGVTATIRYAIGVSEP